jgi:hypothetical protein
MARRVNTQERSATAIGSIRRAQIALGRAGRIHVVWNGSDSAQPGPRHGLPLLDARATDAGDGFEPQRNLVTAATGTDGGGTVAADASGRVFVACHTNPDMGSDARRAAYVARSEDEGRSFAREEPVSPAELGACACCSMRAFAARDGSLLLFYRAAGNDVDRDMTLLRSGDGGRTFSSTLLDRIAFDAAGESLLAWLEGTAWPRGGAVAWQLYDPRGRETGERGPADGVPVWGLAAVAPLADRRCLVLY